jgi:DNA polymerase III delta subunit
MKYILHGDDNVASREVLRELTSDLNVTLLDGKNLTLSIFEESLLSTSLFDDKKAVVVEDLFLKNKKKKDFIKFLKTAKTNTLVVFWERAKVPKTSFSSLSDLNAREFSLPQNYFLFLDTLTPQNSKRVFFLFHELIETKGEELIFYSILKRLRLLLELSNGTTNVSDFKKMTPWQIDKLKKQLRLWNTDKLLNFYSKLQDMEIKLKSGGLPLGLSKHLDILILSEL